MGCTNCNLIPTNLFFLPASTSCNVHSLDTQLIHDRFGNISCIKLVHFPEMQNINPRLVCDTCHISKRSNTAFDLIHVDI